MGKLRQEGAVMLVRSIALAIVFAVAVTAVENDDASGANPVSLLEVSEMRSDVSEMSPKQNLGEAAKPSRSRNPFLQSAAGSQFGKARKPNRKRRTYKKSLAGSSSRRRWWARRRATYVRRRRDAYDRRRRAVLRRRRGFSAIPGKQFRWKRRLQLLGGTGFSSSYIGYGSNKDWYIRSGKSRGKVRIQDNGGEIFLLGGSYRTSRIGYGPRRDWYIRSGKADGRTVMQDGGGDIWLL